MAWLGFDNLRTTTPVKHALDELSARTTKSIEEVRAAAPASVEPVKALFEEQAKQLKENSRKLDSLQIKINHMEAKQTFPHPPQIR